MSINNIDKIKTKTQKKNEINIVVKELRKLLKMPELGDLLEDVVIAGYRRGGSSYHYGSLDLTPKGLHETVGYHDSVGGDEWYLSDSEEKEPRKVKLVELPRIVEEYKVTYEDVVKISNKLSGETK